MVVVGGGGSPKDPKAEGAIRRCSGDPRKPPPRAASRRQWGTNHGPPASPTPSFRPSPSSFPHPPSPLGFFLLLLPPPSHPPPPLSRQLREQKMAPRPHRRR